MAQWVNVLAVESGTEISAWDSQEWPNLPKLSHDLHKHLKSQEHLLAPKRTPNNNEITCLKQRAQENTIITLNNMKLRNWS